MPEQPQRLSLLAQAIELIRDGIQQGRWLEALPQERLLCEELNISRSTLRRALVEIENMGLIVPGERGVRRKISKHSLFQKTIKPESPREKKQLAWLTSEEPDRLPSMIKGLYMETQKRLERHHCEVSMVTLPRLPLLHPDKHLASWIQDFPKDAWVLHSMPDAVQRWFSDHQRNAYLFSNKAEGVELGSISIDNTAALKHGVHMFQRLGHQHIGLVKKPSSFVGELQMEDCFLNSLGDPNSGQASIITCPEHRQEIEQIFSKIFLSNRNNHPTALFCTVPQLAAFSLTWLQQHQFKIPEQVSIVALRSQPFMKFLCPKLAYYSINEQLIVPAALPQMLDLIQTGSCSISDTELVPDFIEGESLAQKLIS